MLSKKININSTILFIVIFISFFITIFVGNFANKSQSNIANNLLRLHVIANSDSTFDQDLKIKVRDAIVSEMTEKFRNSKNINQTRKIANNNIEDIYSVSKKVIDDLGENYGVKVSIGNSYFPTKYYGDMVFPPGTYEAVKVEIGEAKGQNWWCVLFPPLCFVDATNGSVPDSSKQKLKTSLSQEEYDLLTSSSSEKIPVKIKFKSVEVWQASKHNVQVAIKKMF